MFLNNPIFTLTVVPLVVVIALTVVTLESTTKNRNLRIQHDSIRNFIDYHLECWNNYHNDGQDNNNLLRCVLKFILDLRLLIK